MGRRPRAARDDRVTRAIVVRPAAAAEFAQAVTYYQGVGHGERFRAELDRVVDRLRALPESAPMVMPEVRRALLRRYPYALFYVIEPLRLVVLAVLHQRASPSRWPVSR